MNDQDLTLTPLDIAFSRFLAQRAKLPAAEKSAFARCVALLSHQQNQGHNCIRLDDASKALVLASGLAGQAQGADAIRPIPLVVEGDRLYLHRYWRYEDRLARQLKAMTAKQPMPQANLQDILGRYFGQVDGAMDWQCEAAKKAIAQTFCIITGGPGTGKTTTVVKILAILLELADHGLHIALAAPTGKAAMRLQEAIAIQKQKLPCDAAIKAKIPHTVVTMHRLLGAKPPSPYFRHNAQNPLSHDVVVIDEASMVDLALMSKLVDALKPNAKLILLGDKDQLASVESGAVLADLSAAMPSHTVELKISHRFGGSIKGLASMIRVGQTEQAWQMLPTDDGACALLADDPIGYIVEQNKHYLSLIKNGTDYQAIFAVHGSFQTLCANRQGKNSVSDINRRVEQALARQQLINLGQIWYSGRPVLIIENAPAMPLYNGDVGLCLPDHEQGGKLMVFSPEPMAA